MDREVGVLRINFEIQKKAIKYFTLSLIAQLDKNVKKPRNLSEKHSSGVIQCAKLTGGEQKQ